MDTNRKIILGIQEAHDASAALMIDGEVVAAVQEERFTGLKGDYGYPEQSINYCLRHAGVNSTDISEVVLASHQWNPVLTKIKRNANFTVSDWVKEQHEFWRPTLFEKKKISHYEIFKDRGDFSYDNTYPMEHLLSGYMDPEEMKDMARIRKSVVAQKLNLPTGKVRTVTHEDCHTFYSYFAGPLRGDILALTSEGIGDYSNGTVSTFNESGRVELSSTRDNHIGHIYQYITLILGMKPAQHEYKVMGLAPYSNIKELEKSYKVFKDILKVEGLNIVYDKRPSDLYFWFRDNLEGHRFDGIAGGLQRFVEEILCNWVQACTEKTGLKRICFSGGVAQNIKANKAISELGCVEDIYVCPAAGDTSISIGACYFAMWEHLRSNGISTDSIKPLDNIYLGPEYSRDEIRDILKEEKIEEDFKILRDVTPEYIAGLLSDGNVLARCVSRMEFGLRALGNRSILADPRRYSTVSKINAQIKFRDFWMPFTPTILAKRADDYIINPKNIKSPYMTMAFDTTALAQHELAAALHPADLTARPQILEAHSNPAYYELIEAFERKTGVGAVLNTSLNLHGLPIVLGPREAVYTLRNSGLDALILGDYLIMRR